jgi:hypothetical protein
MLPPRCFGAREVRVADDAFDRINEMFHPTQWDVMRPKILELIEAVRTRLTAFTEADDSRADRRVFILERTPQIERKITIGIDLDRVLVVDVLAGLPKGKVRTYPARSGLYWDRTTAQVVGPVLPDGTRMQAIEHIGLALEDAIEESMKDRPLD